MPIRRHCHACCTALASRTNTEEDKERPRWGLSPTKAGRGQQRRPDVARARRDWIRHRLPAMQAQPDRLVFIDETSVKTNMTRTRGRAP